MQTEEREDVCFVYFTCQRYFYFGLFWFFLTFFILYHLLRRLLREPSTFFFPSVRRTLRSDWERPCRGCANDI